MSEDHEAEDDNGSAGSFSIRIVNEEGEGVRDAKVSVVYEKIIGTTHDEAYTDDDGWAELPVPSRRIKGFSAVLVNGEEVSNEYVDPYDGMTMSFTISTDN